MCADFNAAIVIYMYTGNTKCISSSIKAVQYETERKGEKYRARSHVKLILKNGTASFTISSREIEKKEL